MEKRQLNLSVLKETVAVCKLLPAEETPSWAHQGQIASITRTDEELSIVCAEENVPPTVQAERGFRCLKVEGPIAFGTPGIFTSIAVPLAEARISIFALSTFNTDYLLLKEEDLQQALEALKRAGHRVIP